MPVVPGTIRYRFDIVYLSKSRSTETFIAVVDKIDGTLAVAELNATVGGVVEIQSVTYKGLAAQPGVSSDNFKTPQGEF